jgi:PAS domain S-box-containing protein
VARRLGGADRDAPTVLNPESGPLTLRLDHPLKVSAEDFFAAVLETTAQPICVVDPDGVIRFANPAAIAALGYDGAEELFGRHGRQTSQDRRPDGTPHLAADSPMLLPRATAETVARDLDWLVRRDGSMVPVSFVSVPIELPEGRGVVVAFADAAARVRGEQVRQEHEAILAAQRRVATLVAGGADSADVFAAIAREVGNVIGLPLVAVWRYEPDGTTTVIGAWGERAHPFQAGTRWPLDGPTIVAQVLKTGRPARFADFAHLPGTIARAAREGGIGSGAGAPIVVDGDVWGVMVAASSDRGPLPDHIEDRLGEFTELVATAISKTASRTELTQLADEQAALRRVATLVARGAPPAELFAAVVEEVRRVLPLEFVAMARYESDGTMTVVATSSTIGDRFPVGGRWALEGETVSSVVAQTGRPARIDSYDDASGRLTTALRERGLHSSVGTPIVVEGRVWGVMMASARPEQLLPADAEAGLASFTELVATAISNTDARIAARRLAEEQAALRRVATLVAQGVPSTEIFSAVTEEVGRLLHADLAGMIRYEPDDMMSVVATWAAMGKPPAVRDRLPTEEGDPARLIATTRRAARIDDWNDVPGPIAAFLRVAAISSSVGSPILVEGRVWGVLAVHTQRPEFPADAESRLENFTDLVATAISNSEARNELAASRARIVAATDEERRRVVRDLHDGAQQRLVHTVITLKLAHRAFQNPEKDDAGPLLTAALGHAEQATAELRELVHGILPAVLTHGGLRAGVDALASRMPVPVENGVSVGRLPAAVEATAYFIVAEALTNVAKHARAGHATVTARIEDGALRVQVRDDGIGGARSDGSGLLGLADRLSVLHGNLRIESPAAGGTLVAAELPLT